MKETIGDNSPSRISEVIMNLPLFQGASSGLLAAVRAEAELVNSSPRDVLIRKGDRCDSMLFVVAGSLSSAGTADAMPDVVFPFGSCLGVIETLTGGYSGTTVRSDSDSTLLKISKAGAERIETGHPEFYSMLLDFLNKEILRRRAIEVLNGMFGTIVRGNKCIELYRLGELIYLKKGEILYRTGDPGESFYIIITGRMTAVFPDQEDVKNSSWELFSGDCIGELSFLMGESRNRTVSALRDSYLLKYSRNAVRTILKNHPRVLVKITQMLVNHLRSGPGRPTGRCNLRNFAVIPAVSCNDITLFIGKLVEALSKLGPTLCLTPDKLDMMTGIPGIAHTVDDGIFNFYLSTWLETMEHLHTYIIFQTDAVPTPWTKICVNYSDSIIIAADADGTNKLGDIENSMVFGTAKIALQKKFLALTHPANTILPENTATWLRDRPVDFTIHLRNDSEADFNRMARILTDNAICLVLSGGGARGFAHIGVIRAMEEQGIPIDMVGGTSQGAGLGLGIAYGYNSSEILRLSKKGFVEHNPLRDYTFPLVSLLRGKKLEKVHKESCGATSIEDLWLNFFCISCNLTKSEISIIDKGPAWKALRASSSIPGLLPPVIYDGCLHVDGGVVNNFPVDIMKKRVKGIIIASDTSFEEILRVDDERYPGPIKIIFRKLNPFTRNAPTPTIKDILMQAATISSMEKRRMALNNADLYLQPPVINFGILDMKKADEIADAGYRYATAVIEEWKRSGKLKPHGIAFIRA